MKYVLSFIILAAGLNLHSYAQHEMPGMNMGKKETTKPAVKKPAAKKKTATVRKTNAAAKKTTIKKALPDSSIDNMHMNMQDTISKNPGKKDSMSMDHDMNGMNMPDTVPKKDSATHHNMMNMTDTVPKKMDSSMHDHDMMNMNDNMSGMDDDMGHMSMSHVYSLNLPMNRNGSGTGWLPDASPMEGYMFHSSKWMYMLHGNIFVRYNNQDFSNKGSRGDTQFDAPNWIMFMGQREAGKNGLFHFSSMISLDAVVTGEKGYPLLFQTGETANGRPLVDRQHPHDLFSELAISYSYALSKKTDVFAYLGYPGEPALGPVTFMHRPSSLDNPNAPISHHWVDATHITFGAATIGIRYGDWKIEGSSFTGREPDENRYDFDRPRFDSWSGRLSFNPSANWALQVSHAYVNSPESLHPDENIHRTTASAVYANPWKDGSLFNATALWGMNKLRGQDGENAFLLEASWRKNKIAVYSRYEFTQKSSEELSLDKAIYGENSLFNVQALTIGTNYDLLKIGKTRLAAGGQLIFYHEAQKLESLYGKDPIAFEIYLRLYPSLMSRGSN